MSILFEPVQVNGIEIRNRLVRSATNIGAADDQGFVTDAHLDSYRAMANNGIGLIITGATNVQENGQILPFQKHISSDKHIDGLRRLVEVAQSGGAKIAVQLFHGGAEAGGFAASKGLEAIAPSQLGDDPNFPFFKAAYKGMSLEDIHQVVQSFGNAARRAKMAGFDAVQLHGAHGYLFSQFLSPYANQRKDHWGGTLENRIRFFKEVYKEIRNQVGVDYPVMIKLGVQDSFEGGMQFEEGKEAVRLLAEVGFDSFEISSGCRGSGWEETEFRAGIRKIEQEAYYRLWSRELKPIVKNNLMLAGGLRSIELMEEIVNSGDAQLVSLSRPLVREPDLAGRWQAGDRRPSTCISCNQCINVLLSQQVVHCVQDAKKQAKENKA